MVDVRVAKIRRSPFRETLRFPGMFWLVWSSIINEGYGLGVRLHGHSRDQDDQRQDVDGEQGG